MGGTRRHARQLLHVGRVQGPAAALPGAGRHHGGAGESVPRLGQGSVHAQRESGCRRTRNGQAISRHGRHHQQSEHSLLQHEPVDRSERATLYSHKYILLPDAHSAGDFNPAISSVAFDGEQAKPGENIEEVTPPPLYGMEALSGSPGRIHLHWQSVPGAEGYEVFSTSSLDTAFAQPPDPSAESATGALSTAPLSAGATDAYLAGTNGRNRDRRRSITAPTPTPSAPSPAPRAPASTNGTRVPAPASASAARAARRHSKRPPKPS